MKKDYTDLTFLLDKSGSMQNLRTDVIGGINRLINEQQAVDGICKLTLIQFDYSPFQNSNPYSINNFGGVFSTKNGYEIMHNAKDIKGVPPLTLETYVPRGNTAYLDALGKSITETGERLAALPESERPEKVVFVIYTDGMENASVRYTKNLIAKMIKEQTETYKWQFVFLGANMDAVSEGESLGVQVQCSATYAANSAGVSKGFEYASHNLRSYRAGTASHLGFSDLQKRSLVEDE